MNVAFDPWIPVVSLAGERKQISLAEIFSDGEKYSDLAVRPHERVALMRLFICVAHAALNGPKDYDEWLQVPEKLPTAAREYLAKWKVSFELFHETRPWLQVAGLSKSPSVVVDMDKTDDWTPVSKLNFSFATGNNTTLFDHEGLNEKRVMSISEIIVSMLAFQCFSPGGLISQVFWNGCQTNKSSKDGPCVSSSMVHSFVRSNNLLASIRLNIPTFEDIRYSYGDREIGAPVWEKIPLGFVDPERVDNATRTYVGRLVPMTRLICLHPTAGRMMLGDGFQYPSFAEGFPQEPTATLIVKQIAKKEERALLSFRPSKAYWRELTAIIVKRNADGIGGPLSLRSLSEADNCDLIISALTRDQATIVDTKESVFHISASLRSPNGTVVYEAEVKGSEAMASRLGWAIESYRTEIDGGWEGRLKGAGASKGELKSKLHSVGTTQYWTTVEKNLPLLFAHIESLGTDADTVDTTRDLWHKMLFSSASEAYRTACGQNTPRQIRAFAKGWHKLTSAKDRAPSDISQITEEEA